MSCFFAVRGLYVILRRLALLDTALGAHEANYAPKIRYAYPASNRRPRMAGVLERGFYRWNMAPACP